MRHSVLLLDTGDQMGRNSLHFDLLLFNPSAFGGDIAVCPVLAPSQRLSLGVRRGRFRLGQPSQLDHLPHLSLFRHVQRVLQSICLLLVERQLSSRGQDVWPIVSPLHHVPGQRAEAAAKSHSQQHHGGRTPPTTRSIKPCSSSRLRKHSASNHTE